MANDGAVLVVDDETAVRNTLAAMLAHHGYAPLPACDGAAAVEALRTAPEPVVAALVDRPAVVDAVRAARPGLPCVLLSGNPALYDRAEVLARGAAAVCAKPIELKHLGRVVADAIGHG